MINRFKPRMEIMPIAQRRLWPELQPATQLGFVLYGGTAIALRLGHRTSVDFDFFSSSPLNHEAIRDFLPFVAQSTVIQDEKNSLTMLVPSNIYHLSESGHVKVSLFGAITFGRVGEPEMTEDEVLQVASLDDLMATKLKVILQRAEAKDYRDIAAMLKEGMSLSRGLAAARIIYGSNFQPSESLKALIYFKDGDLPTLDRDKKQILVTEVKAVRQLPEISLLANQLI